MPPLGSTAQILTTPAAIWLTSPAMIPQRNPLLPDPVAPSTTTWVPTRVEPPDGAVLGQRHRHTRRYQWEVLAEMPLRRSRY
jgi:hypothetical protein